MERYLLDPEPEEVQSAVLCHLQEEEQNHLLPKGFLKNTGLPFYKRAKLANWLTIIYDYLDLRQSTLHLAVRLVDAYVVCKKAATDDVVRKKLETYEHYLLGFVALIIAAKCEETYPDVPSIPLLLRETCLNPVSQAYTLDDVLDMEKQMLKVLDFRIYRPLRTDFLLLFIKCMPPQHPVLKQSRDCLWHLSTFLLDLTLHDHRIARWSPSMVAASCLYLAARIVVAYGSPELEDDEDCETFWGPQTELASMYAECDLRPCVSCCADILFHARSSPYQAAREAHDISDWEGLQMKVVETLMHDPPTSQSSPTCPEQEDINCCHDMPPPAKRMRED